MNPVPRHSLWWFFIAQLAVVAPHVPRLPWWLLGVWLVCAAWRIQVFRGHWSWPGKVAKSAIVFAVLMGILVWYRNPTALESAAGTVIALFFLKMLECYQRRDVYLLIFVSIFVAAMNFLFDQGLLTSLWVFFSIILVLLSLVSLHEPQESTWYSAIKPVTVLVFQALPLMLVLFLVFPRLSPIWAVPLPGSGQARTGMSNSMSPGDISQLGRSADLAFRVTFDGRIPASSRMYWRGLVLDHFDGRHWTPQPMARYRNNENADLASHAVSEYEYEVLLEPTGANWLFALEDARSNTEGVIRLANGTLSSKKTVTSRFAYQAESASSGQRVLSAVERSISLQLPKTLNLRTQEWARMLREQSADDERFITNVLTYLREQPFYYSLDAPLLGRDSVDEFLFSTRKGFCEHYASSVAFALRAAGVPARVVVGYLGAEANGDYFLVHQYDAHAWVEAWIEGDGWVMVDPTAAVAPERIERGMSAWVDTGDGVLSGSGANFWARRYPLIGKMRLLFDQVDYQWQRWVMGYDAERQTDTLVNLLGEITPARVAALMMGVLGLALGGVVLSLWGREWLRARDPLTQAYEDFCAALARQGVPRAVGEAAGDYAARAAERRPDLAQRIRSVTTLYESLAYRRHTDAQYHNGIRLLRAEVRRFVRESLFSKAPVRKQHNNEGNH